MKVIKTASGNQIKMSKSEWTSIGKTAGWMDNPKEKAIDALQIIAGGLLGLVGGVVVIPWLIGTSIWNDIQVNKDLKNKSPEDIINDFFMEAKEGVMASGDNPSEEPDFLVEIATAIQGDEDLKKKLITTIYDNLTQLMSNKGAYRELRDFYLKHLVSPDQKEAVTNEIKQTIEQKKSEGMSRDEILKVLDQSRRRYESILTYHEMKSLTDSIEEI